MTDDIFCHSIYALEYHSKPQLLFIFTPPS